jgi:UDP-N-acetylmuramate dehydrogenase
MSHNIHHAEGFIDSEKLLDRLPPVRGRYREYADLARTSWFKVGGPAEVLFKPADREDLSSFLAACPEDIPITILAVCSNVIIRDGGIRGVVIKLGREFGEIDINEDEQIITAGAAALDLNVAMEAARKGCEGLEFLSGIPGSIGGALRMNGGAYGSETADVLIEAEVIDRSGQIHHLSPQEMGMAYRHNDIPENFIFTGARFKTSKGNPDTIMSRINAIKDKREETQPIKEQTGGSTFANPTAEQILTAGLPEGTKTWQLIDKVGGRGLMIGGAQMSEKHCNFMINTGEATAEDLENLGEEIRRRVREEFGIELRWEIKRIGLKRQITEEPMGTA